MRAFSGPTVVEQPVASNRRQPLRQTRTNPARTASTVTQAQGAILAQPPDNDQSEGPGFFPAITHFTDAMTALPKEMIRHYTMLKEVDAKIYGPEAQLGQLFKEIIRSSPLPRPSHNASHASRTSHSDALALPNAPTSSAQPADASHLAVSSDHRQADPAGSARRNQFHRIRHTLATILPALDEKSHVLNTAVEGLEKQTKRWKSSYPHIADEISEEARYGSMTHWAYTAEKTAKKEGIMAGERTRRAAAIQEEGAAVRSTQRREAITDRKRYNNYIDSDFDDLRVSKKPNASGKGKKPAEAVGLGLANGAPPSKRRKIEKLSTGGRAMGSVYGESPATSRVGASNSRDMLAVDAGKKKVRGGATTNGSGRRRGNTNASLANSPSLASSPVVGTFAAADRQGRSPAPAAMKRMPSARARQNSTQSVLQAAQARSSSANHRGTNGTGHLGSTVDVEKVSNMTGRSTGDVKNNMRETINSRGEHLIEDIGNDGAGEMKGGLLVGSRNSDRSLKREESVNGNGNGRTRPPSISTRGGNSKGPSKTATPINTSFGDAPRPRREIPAKRSHKKGAGLAAQLAAQSVAQEDEGSSLQDDEDDDEGDEPRYCYCNQVSYGQMVGCDNKECAREWFHLECVGLSKPPRENITWYCDECKANLKDSKFKTTKAR